MAAAPFFLGAVLGKKTPFAAESGPVLPEEEGDEILALDEFETAALPTEEEDLDFAGPPLSDDDLEEQDQPLPSLGLEDIDVSDLVPPLEEEEELVFTPESEQEEALQRSTLDADTSLMGIEMPSLESDDLMRVDEEEESLLRESFEDEHQELQANAEDDEIVDLSSLMNFDEPATDTEEDQNFLGLSLGNEPDELHLSLDDGEDGPAPAEAPEKPATAMADIPDLGLTLENDDQQG